MAKKRYYGNYEGASNRRSMEMKDAGMLSEDRSAVANMPQDVKYHPWPSAHEGLDSYLDDTIRGVNKQMNEDESGARRNLGVHKW